MVRHNSSCCLVVLMCYVQVVVSFELTAAEQALLTSESAKQAQAAEATREEKAFEARTIPMKQYWKTMSASEAAALQQKLRISIGDTDAPTAAPTALWDEMEHSILDLKAGLKALNARLSLVKHAHVQHKTVIDAPKKKASSAFVSNKACTHFTRGTIAPNAGAFTFDSTHQTFGLPKGMTVPTAGMFCPFKIQPTPQPVAQPTASPTLNEKKMALAGQKRKVPSHKKCEMPYHYAYKCKKLGGCCDGLVCHPFKCGTEKPSGDLTKRQQELAQFIKKIVLKPTSEPTVKPTHIVLDSSIQRFHTEAAKRKKRSTFSSNQQLMMEKMLHSAMHVQRKTHVQTLSPTYYPTSIPTVKPTPVPTSTPTVVPSSLPTTSPTNAPVPTALPTLSPTGEAVLRKKLEKANKNAYDKLVKLRQEDQQEEQDITKLRKKLSKRLASSHLEDEDTLAKMAKKANSGLGKEEAQIKKDFAARADLQKQMGIWKIKSHANVSAEIEAIYRKSAMTAHPTSTPSQAPTPVTLKMLETTGKVEMKLLDAEFAAARNDSTSVLLAKLHKELEQAVKAKHTAKQLRKVAQDVVNIDDINKNQETKILGGDLTKAAMLILRPLLLQEIPGTLLFAPTNSPTKQPTVPTKAPTLSPTWHAVASAPPQVRQTPAPAREVTPRDDDTGDDDTQGDDDHHDIDSSVTAAAVAAANDGAAEEKTEVAPSVPFSATSMALLRGANDINTNANGDAGYR
jgi:hypothetical protein